MITDLFEHRDVDGDRLDIARITNVARGDGITVGVTDRHGFRVAANLPDAEAVAMLALVAQALGYDVVITGEVTGG